MHMVPEYHFETCANAYPQLPGAPSEQRPPFVKGWEGACNLEQTRRRCTHLMTKFKKICEARMNSYICQYLNASQAYTAACCVIVWQTVIRVTKLTLSGWPCCRHKASAGRLTASIKDEST